MYSFAEGDKSGTMEKESRQFESNRSDLRMEQIVHSFVKEHQLISPHQTVLAAVSGGPDSMALLHFLCSIKNSWNLKIIGLSVDHGLRGQESQDDLEFVKNQCEEWGIEFAGASVDVHSHKREAGTGTQESARYLRYQFFERMMEERQADVLAMGHHGDDQAETMMMQLVRSARPESLQGMPVQRPFGRGKLVRPFLSLSKSQIADYNAWHHVRVRIDPSNEETNYTRNAFRKHVMPFLKEQNPKFHSHMQAMSQRMREDQAYIREQAGEVLDTMYFSSNMKKIVQFSLSTFKTFPLALQRSAFHLILNYLYVNQTEDISYLHEEMFMNLLYDHKPNAKLDFPQGLQAVRAYDEVTLSFDRSDEEYKYEYFLNAGETVVLPDGAHLYADWGTPQEKEGDSVFTCDAHHVKLPFIVRTRRNGDRMRVRGMNGSKKVKDIFIDQKIPSNLRKTWPLVTDSSGEILWLVGLKKSGGSTDGSSGTWLRLHYENKAET